MALQNLFGELSLETTQQEMLAQMTLLLAAILENMPRTDSNARAIVNTSDQGNVTVSIAATQTLATVTTVGTVTTVSTVGNQTNIGGRDASNTAYALANMGTAHIYNNIIVS